MQQDIAQYNITYIQYHEKTYNIAQYNESILNKQCLRLMSQIINTLDQWGRSILHRGLAWAPANDRVGELYKNS